MNLNITHQKQENIRFHDDILTGWDALSGARFTEVKVMSDNNGLFIKIKIQYFGH